MSSKNPKKVENLLERIKNYLHLGAYRDTSHAIERKTERNITIPEIIHVLQTGRHEKSKDHFEEEIDLLIITAFYIKERH